ncbi:MAG: glycoside hydrolase family 38 C-terminal domain-containing protein [Verrucomicrobiota bacterium]
MPKKKTIHLLCNAHLDPVWLWEWQEGAAEALSTFRTAAELCEENESFVFNHNEAILYKWVQQYEPSLFKRIQKLVRQGRWHIMGGWYLQPDCNMPSGESFVRQILMGKSYFKKHFGVDVKTAINFDPFGHSRGLVQILAKSGYDSYLFGRPTTRFLDLPADEFVWTGFDGSEVLATRFCGWYNSPYGKAAEKIEQWLKDFGDKEHCLILWGVGNHGGGPSKIDLRKVNKLIAGTDEYDIRHSTPKTFFRQLARNKENLPRYGNDLNPWAKGCYISQIRIKQKQRLLENEIYSCEKMCSAAAMQNLMEYPTEKIDAALEDLMLGQFHDILPGSSIEAVEEAALRTIDHGLETVSRLKALAFFALSTGQKKPKAGQIPVLVYNPHPYPVEQLVECEFNLEDAKAPERFFNVQAYDGNKPLPSQTEQEQSNLAAEWRKRVVFPAVLKPSQMNRFDCRLEELPAKPETGLKPRAGKIVFTTKKMEVVVNTKTGLIDKYRVNGVDFAGKNAFEPIIMKDNADCWDEARQRYGDVVGRFELMDEKAATEFAAIEKGVIKPVRVIEDGPVRCVVEALFAYNHSFICQRYKLSKSSSEIEVETEVLWNEKNKMLKLSVPTPLKNGKYIGQTAYGVNPLENNGNESVAQKWVAIVDRKKNAALTCINNGTYSSDFSKDGLRLTLLRSPAYSCAAPYEGRFPMPVPDRYTPRIDQGKRSFRFWLNAGRVAGRLNAIDREALAKNEAPFVLSFWPSGEGKKPKPLVELSDKVVQVAAIKKAEKNNGLIIRLFEPTGRKRSTTLSLPFIGRKTKIDLKPFEIKTLRVKPKSKIIEEVDLLEKPIRKS